MIIKLMSFNIQSSKNYITKEFDPLLMAKVIEKEKVDIIGLNEVRDKGRCPDFTANAEIIKNYLGYEYGYFAQTLSLKNGPYGNAIISKYPIKSITKVMIEDPTSFDLEGYYESRCIIKAEIENLTIFVIHVGLVITEQINAINTLKKLLSEISGNVIVMGDFNMEDDHYLIAELKSILKCSSIYFEKPLLSFPSIDPVKRIDYIFTSPNIKVLESNIPQIVASDHFPITITIDA